MDLCLENSDNKENSSPPSLFRWKYRVSSMYSMDVFHKSMHGAVYTYRVLDIHSQPSKQLFECPQEGMKITLGCQAVITDFLQAGNQANSNQKTNHNYTLLLYSGFQTGLYYLSEHSFERRQQGFSTVYRGINTNIEILIDFYWTEKIQSCFPHRITELALSPWRGKHDFINLCNTCLELLL